MGGAWCAGRSKLLRFRRGGVGAREDQKPLFHPLKGPGYSSSSLVNPFRAFMNVLLDFVVRRTVGRARVSFTS